MKEYIDIFFGYTKTFLFFVIGCIVIGSLLVLMTVPLELVEKTSDWRWYLCYIPAVFGLIGVFSGLEYRDRKRKNLS